MLKPNIKPNINTTDYFIKEEESKNYKKTQTNPKYLYFNQHYFTAGDIEQFLLYYTPTNGKCPTTPINIKNNIFYDVNFNMYIDWVKYKNLQSSAVLNTFNYMFNKFKKGIYVKIQNNKLEVFLPFSNQFFENEWWDIIDIDPKYAKYYNELKYKPYGDVSPFLKKLYGLLWFETYQQNLAQNKNYTFNYNYIKDIKNWYANNCILRYDKVEGDHNTPMLKDMFLELCNTYKIPDIEFFVNRRDFPILRNDDTEAYNSMFGEDKVLLSYNYTKYLPILSMVTTNRNADIPIPTGYGWQRVNPDKYFPETSCDSLPQDFPTKWSDKKNTAVFRGSSTGCGYDIETNLRLKLAYISENTPPDENNIPYIDAGITKFNTRLRKIPTQKNNLRPVNVEELFKKGLKLKEFLTPEQQSQYKYIINVDGHVSAFRLSLELNMGSVILLAKSDYKMWFSFLLKPLVHYVPVKKDLSDLIYKIKWCRENDKKCEKIANNAKIFYKKYLSKKGYLDYLQKLFIDLKNYTGNYVYNYKTPFDIQLNEQKKNLDNNNLYYPSYFIQSNTDSNNFILSNKPIENPTIYMPFYLPKFFSIPEYSYMKGVNWFINSFSKNFFKIVDYYKIKKYSYTEKLTDYLFPNLTISCQDIDYDGIHECFISINGINNIRKSIPNFQYTYNYITKNNTTNSLVILKEKIENSITLLDYINSSHFNFTDYLYIIYQINLSLLVAQREYGFIHWDLIPQNIYIKILKNKEYFNYNIMDEIVTIHTNIIPIITNFYKSNCIIDNIQYGYKHNMYEQSWNQDIYTIILKSLTYIIPFKKNKNTPFISFEDKKYILNLLKFLYPKDNLYIQTSGDPLYDIKKFIQYNSEYLLNNSISPFNHFKSGYDINSYLCSNHIYNIKKSNIYYNIGNSLQVFNYILSNTLEGKYHSFLSFFEKVNNCKIVSPKFIITTHYIKNISINSLTSVQNQLKLFLKNFDENFTINQKQDILHFSESIINKFNATYSNLIQKQLPLFKNEKLEYSNNIQLPLSLDFFMNIDRLYLLTKAYFVNKPNNIIKYRVIIEDIINSDNNPIYNDYKTKFKDLIYTKGFDEWISLSNQKTLLYMSCKLTIYNLKKISEHKNCKSYNKIKKKYINLLKIFL